MALKAQRNRDWLRKRSRQGFRGYPVGTVAFYGPDDKCASKVAVGIILREDEEVEYLERWSIPLGDIRSDLPVPDQVAEFLKSHKAKSVVLTERIIGCPHEEGKDYPEGETCPECPFWANRDRWTGAIISGKNE